MLIMDDIKQVKHLFACAAFGMRFEDLKHYKSMPVKKAVKNLFSDSENADPITAVTDNSNYEMLMKGDVAAKKMFMQAQREQEKDLNLAWVTKMSTTNATLREKMTLFWSNHFACRTQ